MKHLTVAVVVLVCLTGCVTAPPPRTEATDPTGCLDVSDQAQSSLQEHLDAKMTPQQVLDIAAVLSPNATEDEPAWFVAATVDSQGDKVTAVWFTTNDPTAPEPNAYLSVDAMAETISDYRRPNNASAAMDGAQQAEACLK